MKFLKKLGLDEKTKFLLETSGDNLIDLDQEVVEEIIPSNQEQQAQANNLFSISQSALEQT